MESGWVAGGVVTVIFDEVTGAGGKIDVVGRTELWGLIGGESDTEGIEEAGGMAGIEGFVEEETNTVAGDAEAFCGGLCDDDVWPI